MELIDPIKSLHTDKTIPEIDTAKANVIFDIVFGLTKAQALLVAHDLDLFSIIDKNNSISLEEISTLLDIQPRPTQALLSMCASLALVALNAEHKFELTEIAKHFLLKKSPFYIGGALDITLINGEIYSFKSFRHAIQNNSSQVYQGKDLFQTNEEQEELARKFTHAMHCKSMVMANQWPQKIDLSIYKTFLDIGGGSGAHSITTVLKWDHLYAIVYDRPAVCEVAQGKPCLPWAVIAKNKLSIF